MTETLESSKLPRALNLITEGFLVRGTKSLFCVEEGQALSLPFLHKLYNAAVGPNNFSRGMGEREPTCGSSMFTILIMCGFIASSPASG